MPRTSGITIQNSFTGGLITEGTALNFPKNAATDTDNCVFQYTGSCRRRTDIDFEDGYAPITLSGATSADVYTEYIWNQVNDSGSNAFFVQQQGDTIRFFDNTSGTNVSNNYISGSQIDLTSFIPDGSTLDPSLYPVQFAQGNGVLLCVGRAIEPLIIEYNSTTNTFGATVIDIQTRDFIGLPSPYTDNQRPSFSTIANLVADPVGVIHYYNLLNQGWWAGTIDTGIPSSTSALGQWDTARADMPSNADDYRMYQASETDLFDGSAVDVVSGGLGLAAKGHFILDIGAIDRRQAAVDQGYTINITGITPQLIPAATGTVLGNLTATSAHYTTSTATYSGALSHSFDGIYNPASGGVSAKASTFSVDAFFTSQTKSTSGYVGKNFGGSPQAVYSAKAYAGGGPSGNQFNYGWTNIAGTELSGKGIADYVIWNGNTATAQLRASNSAPSAGTDGTLLGSTTIPSGSTFVEILSSDSTTTYQYWWIYITGTVKMGWGSVIHNADGSGSGAVYTSITEMEVFKPVTFDNVNSFSEPDKTTERPQVVAYYAGRAWYGGIQHDTSSNVLYFSQIVERPDQYGRCFQQNDPTSNIYFDLLATDGGYIKIPEMGAVKKLFVYQTSLVVLADNGVWLIRGSSGAGFLATDYVVRKLSSLGTQSPQSVVDVDGVPYWWGEAAILRLDYNPQFDSFEVTSITDTTIRTFYLDIGITQRAQAKAAYDPYNKYVYWLYTDTANSRQAGAGYNRVLVYNVRSQAFFPWSTNVILDDSGLEITPVIQGMLFVQDANGISTPMLKYTTTYQSSGDTILTYADQGHLITTYIDWSVYSALISNTAVASDYQSYFVSGYEIDGQIQQFAQPNYVILVLEQNYEADGTRIDSSAFLQGVFDFALSGNTGKWSTIAQSSQQIFNNSLVDRSVNWRRLKIRGKGRSIQFRVISETGKPFAVVGWSTWKTANSQV